jgi:hypothetical protein
MPLPRNRTFAGVGDRCRFLFDSKGVRTRLYLFPKKLNEVASNTELSVSRTRNSW